MSNNGSTNFKLEISGANPIPSTYLEPLPYSKAGTNFVWKYYASNFTENQTFNLKLIVELNGQILTAINPLYPIDNFTLKPLIFRTIAEGIYIKLRQMMWKIKETLSTLHIYKISIMRMIVL